MGTKAREPGPGRRKGKVKAKDKDDDKDTGVGPGVQESSGDAARGVSAEEVSVASVRDTE